MTNEQRIQIGNLRVAGLGYKKIAEQMGISENTVKTYCRRHGLGGKVTQQIKGENIYEAHCLCCGVAIRQIPGRKKKKFCSDKCRNQWWNSHLHLVKRKAVYSFECPTCKKPFTAYGNAKRKYCSLECYAKRNRGGEE